MIIHTVGAVLAFFLGLAYFWVQLYLTYRAQPSQDRWWVGPVRATFCIICTVTVIVSILPVFKLLHAIQDNAFAHSKNIQLWRIFKFVFIYFNFFYILRTFSVI